MRRLAFLAVVPVLLALGLAPSSASADFTAPALISGSRTVESDYGFEPAISANGRYVAFTGSQTGVRGVFRKDLLSGNLALVAKGDAGAPSISADGRYVSFTTSATSPGAGRGTQCSSVYVRDMAIAYGLAGAYTLASAIDGGSGGLTYGGSGQAGCPGGGSSAAAGVALSADGREVAFTVVGASDLLTGPGGPTSTPGAQVALRDLDTLRTTLVSQTMASLGSTPAAVPAGAAMTDNSTGAGTAQGTRNAGPGDSTAAISADGSTVAWLGIDIPQQAPAAQSDVPNGRPNEYDEPLWRRIADGSRAPTRRVTGGDDAVGPCTGAGCIGPLDTQWLAPSDPVTGDSGPERGTFLANAGFIGAGDTFGSSLADATPQLSADGRTVAILSTQPATGQDPVYTQKPPQNVSANAFVVNMAPGLDRSHALTRVTEWASTNFSDFPLAGPIEHLVISPEGDRLAFATQRTQFPFSPPALISPQLTDVGFEQLYVANLADGTLELASTGFDGQPANSYVLNPSFSAAGGPIAFSSSATNLVYGGFSSFPAGGEVYTTTELKPPSTPGGQQVGPAPPNPPIVPAWVLSVTAGRGRGGLVTLYISVPGAGRLSADARAAVPRAAGPRTSGPGSLARGHRGHRRRRGRVVTKTLASAGIASRSAGLLTLRLEPAARYARLIAGRHGIYATVTVRFRAPGHRPLSQQLPFVLRAGPKHHRHSSPRGAR